MDDFDLTGMTEPAPGIAGWPEPARRALGIGAGCSVLVLLELLVIWLSITAMLNARVPEGMVVRTDVVPRITDDGKTHLRITVRNDSDRSFTLRSITARAEALRRFQLENASPAPPLGKKSLFGSDVWTYDQVIAPHKSWSVKLQVTPRSPGALRGVLELQAGSGIAPALFTLPAPPAERHALPANSPRRQDPARR